MVESPKKLNRNRTRPMRLQSFGPILAQFYSNIQFDPVLKFKNLEFFYPIQFWENLNPRPWKIELCRIEIDRFGLVSYVIQSNSVLIFSKPKSFLFGLDFGRKIWNQTRVVLCIKMTFFFQKIKGKDKLIKKTSRNLMGPTSSQSFDPILVGFTLTFNSV